MPLFGLLAGKVAGGIVKGLFKKKPGGTFVGNLLRKGASKLLNNRPIQQSAQIPQNFPNAKMNIQSGGNDNGSNNNDNKKFDFVEFLKKWGGYIVGVIGIIITIILTVLPKGRRYRR